MHCPNCRAALPPNSRFCNACGAAIGAGGNPPTVSMPPQGSYQQQPTMMPGANQTRGYAPQPPQQYVPPVGASEPRKPVALLAAAIALIVLLIGLGAFALTRGSRNPVVAGTTPAPSNGPGVQMAQGSPGAPPTPGVVAQRGGPPPDPGKPVVAAPTKPDDGMAPPVTMAPGSARPSAPGVVTTPSAPPVPAGPNPIAVPSRPAPPAPNPIAQPPRQAAAPPPAPAPPDNRDFDRYLQWLQFVENERAGLRARGETQSFRVIGQFYQAMFGLADPDANDAQIQQQFDRTLQGELRDCLTATRLFANNITRTKPPVPADCRALDSYYMAAVRQEAQTTVLLMDALAHKDIGRIKQVGSAGVGSIDQNLGMANRQLEQVYRQRGLNQQFVIKTGGNSSMLGGMIGLSGMGL